MSVAMLLTFLHLPEKSSLCFVLVRGSFVWRFAQYICPEKNTLKIYICQISKISRNHVQWPVLMSLRVKAMNSSSKDSLNLLYRIPFKGLGDFSIQPLSSSLKDMIQLWKRPTSVSKPTKAGQRVTSGRLLPWMLLENTRRRRRSVLQDLHSKNSHYADCLWRNGWRQVDC